MATQAAISRPYPSTYQTPQSSSPSSVHSPQHDQHGRPWYGQSMTHMPHQMYYSQYPMAQSSPYGQQHHSATSNSSVTSAPSMISSYQQQLQSSQHPSSHPQPPGMNTSPRMKIEQSPMQHRAPASLGPPHGPPVPQQGPGLHGMPPPGPGANPNAAPGPIPATTPLVVRQDSSGVQWIAFEYSRDRVKMEYTIRCDVESVNVEELSQEFKSENCVYPRACCGKDQYKGNRLHYESECNAVGWALAQLNSSLRGKRGLIQRAVDSWRNSNQDPRLRSRRVRRMAKINTRKATAAQQAGGGVLPGPSAPTSASMAGPGGSHVGAPRHPTMMIPAQPMHHHSANPDGNAPPGNQDVSAGNEYNDTTSHHHRPPNGQILASPAEIRHAQSFYPTYPTQPGMSNPSMPSIHDGMDQNHHHNTSSLATPVTASVKDEETNDSKKALFGDLPESKRRKFIL
ncbi:hypothetical protein LTR28_012454, partial [Elasticomyces elasticus]